MGVVKAITSSVSGVFADSWKEVYLCEALPQDVLLRRGKKRIAEDSANTKGDEEYISDGSIIVVPDGVCALVVENGKVHSAFSEPGEKIFRSDKSVGIFSSEAEGGVKSIFEDAARRFTFGGGIVPVNHRVYYVNTKEITGNTFWANGMPFPIYDKRTGLSMDATLMLVGSYSFRIADPVLFYSNVTGNVTEDFRREKLMKQMNSELVTAIGAVLKKYVGEGKRPYQITKHALELCEDINAFMSDRWVGLRGIEIVSVAIGSLNIVETDRKVVQDMQRARVLADASELMTAIQTDAQAQAIVLAAKNKSGPALGFCTECGTEVAGKFCRECGTKRYDLN